MSGIVAIVGPACSTDDWQWLQRATAYMEYRGPDGSNVWHDKEAALGHASLRTCDDVADQLQPFSIDAGAWMTGDVRLDNRDELIRRLRPQHEGITSRTNDTELLLRAYHEWGENCLEHISGDFAFAIWDQRNHRLFCARDQFGVAPLYYAVVKDRLLLSNTLECLLLDERVPDDLNDTAVADFLIFNMNMDQATTTFAHIHRLPPAHALTWAAGTIKTRRYWDVPRWNGFVRHTKAEDYVDQFRDLFTQAVADRLRTNRLSIQLSGGMDSTSVAVTAQRLLKTAGRPFDLRAYTIVLNGLTTDDEGNYAGLVAESAGIPLEYLAAADYADENPGDEPELRTPEPTPYRWTGMDLDFGRRAARHSRVSLSGHGGDAALMFDPSHWLHWLGRGELHRIFAAVWHHIRLFHRLPQFRVRAWIYQLRGRRALSFALPDWLEEAFVRRVDLESRAQQLVHGVGSQNDTVSMATAPVWSNMFGWSDPGFTRLPLKFRHPFFDLRLLTFLLALPPYPWFVRKALLRDAMRNDLPEAVRQRRKTPLVKDLTQTFSEKRGMHATALAFLDSVPGLERYFRRDRFTSRLQSIATTDVQAHRALIAGLGFASWTRYWRRPNALVARTVHEARDKATIEF